MSIRSFDLTWIELNRPFYSDLLKLYERLGLLEKNSVNKKELEVKNKIRGKDKYIYSAEPGAVKIFKLKALLLVSVVVNVGLVGLGLGFLI